MDPKTRYNIKIPMVSRELQIRLLLGFCLFICTGINLTAQRVSLPDSIPSPRLELASVNDEVDAWNVRINLWPSEFPEDWSDGNSPIQQIRIHRRVYGEDEWTTLDPSLNQSSTFIAYTDRNVPEGTYEYALSAVNEAGFESELGTSSAIHVRPFWIRQNLKPFLEGTSHWTTNIVVVRDMIFLNSNIGYALLDEIVNGAGNSGVWTLPIGDDRSPYLLIMKTDNGGNTWEPVNRVLNGHWDWLHFSNPSNGLVLGGLSNDDFRRSVAITSDGAQSFDYLNSQFQWDFRDPNAQVPRQAFYNDVNGAGNNLFIAGNAGLLLRRIANGPFQNIGQENLDINFSRISVPNPQTFFLGSAQAPHLWASFDAGQTIDTLSGPDTFTEPQTNKRLMGLGFLNENTGLFAAHLNGNDFIWKTSDQGQNWTSTDLLGHFGPNGSRINFSWISDTQVYAVYNGSSVIPEAFSSTDAGQTWIKEGMLPSFNQSANVSLSYNQSVTRVGNSQRLILFSGNDTIYHSDLSEQPQATPLASPKQFVAVPENGTIKLTWNHSEALELEGFELLRILEDVKDDPVMLPPDATSYIDDQIAPGQTAIYHLEAIQGNRKSESVSVEITMPDLPPEPAKKPRIVRQTNSIEGGAGATVQLFVEAESDTPLNYTWFFNGQPMPNVTQPGIQIVNLSNEHVGSYVVEVSNTGGKVLSAPMQLEINPANRGGVDIAWDARFESGDGFNSKPVGVYHNRNGGALVAGQFTPNGSNNSDLLVVEYDNGGKQLWVTRPSFSDTSQEFARKSILDKQGNVIVGGSTLVNPAELVDEITPDLPKGPVDLTFLASVGKSGNINWTFTPPVDFTSKMQILDLQIGQSGMLYLLGNMESEEYSGVVVQSLSSNNGRLSDSFFADDKTQFNAIAMAVTNSERIYLVGNSNETAGNASGLQIRCYGSNGRLNWKTDFGNIGVNNFTPTKLHLHESDGVYVVGVSNNPDTGSDIHVVRFDSNGTGEWQNQLGLPGKSEDIPVASQVDNKGALIIAGDSTYPGEHTQITLGKFQTDGNAAWSIVLPHSMPDVSDHVTHMDLDSNGDIFLSAIRHAPGTGQDFASFRFGSDGALIWEASFKQEGFAVEEATHIDADDSGNVVLSGITFRDTQQQIVTIRQTPVPAIVNELPELAFNDRPFRKPVVAPGQWTIELEAKDPDGEVTKVEFLDGPKVLATDTEAPYTMDFAAEGPTTARIFARAYDNLGGVSISEVLTIVVVESPDGAPIGTLQPADSILPEGSDLTLDFGITGSDPIRYQWFLNGERLKGADQPTLPILPNVTRENSGSYRLRAENREGKLLTNPVIVSVDWQLVDGADQFADAAAIRGDSGFVRTSNVDATIENGEPRHSNKRSGNTIWYRWRPEASGLATLSLQGSSFDTLLAVYAGPTLSQLTDIENDDDRGGFSTSRLQFNAIAGVDYMIAIGGFNGASGNILFSWELDAAQLLSIPRIRISPEKNTADFGEPYQLRTSISGNLQGIQLQWFHNGAAIPGATGTTLDIESAQPGDTGAYWITIDAGGATGRTKPAHLTVNVPRRGKIIRELVLEEKFADLFFFVQDFNPAPLFQPQAFGSPFRTAAASLATGFTGAQIFNTFGATKEAGEPDHCGIPGGASQWFAYQAPADGELTISTEGSDFDTVMAVYTSTGSSFADLTEVTCDNDSGADGQDSIVTFNATEDTIYYIAVDGVEAATGTVNLAYELEVGLEVQSVTIAENGMQFEVQTVPNITFVVEGTEDFETWVELISISSDGSPYIYEDNGALTGTRRFYRVYVSE